VNTQKQNSICLLVVIVNYRTPDLVIQCLKALLPELKGTDAKVVVVDNNSQDDSCEMIQNWISNDCHTKMVSIISSQDNCGFSGGNNVGIKKFEAQFYLLLNSDTYVRKGAISRMLDTAVKYPDAGIISPRLEWPSGEGQESCFRFHSPISEFARAAQTGVIDRLLIKYLVPLHLKDEISEPQWTSFACVLIKRKVFCNVGLLDDGYFMYFEDIEFCHRALKSGWKVLNDYRARVVHLRGGSSPVKARANARKRLPRYYYESRTRYFCQVFGWSGLILANILWMLGRVISISRQFTGRHDKKVIALEWRDIWINCISPYQPYTHPGSQND
jgi:GT2 family glycosyltransferase